MVVTRGVIGPQPSEESMSGSAGGAAVARWLRGAVLASGLGAAAVGHAAADRPVDLPAGASAADRPAGDGGCEREIRWHNRTSTALTLHIAGLSPRKIASRQVARWCAPTAVVGYGVRGGDWLYRGQVVVTAGESRQVELTAPGASVYVVNRTAEAQSIALDGDTLGEVVAGESKSFGPVAIGDRHLTAHSLRSSWLWGTQLRLANGARLTVELPSPSGVVRLLNPLAEAAQVAVDGKALGEVARGARLAAIGLGPGAHQVRWVGVASGAVVRQVASTDDALDRRSPTVEVRVANRTGEDLTLPEGLRDVGLQLPAHATATWQLPRGDYGVVATGLTSGLPYKLDVLAKGPAVLTWTLRRPTALLRLHNQSGDAVKVEVPALGPLPIAAGKSALLRVPAGRVALAAHQPHREQPLRVAMFLRGGEEASWRIAAQETALVAANGWSEPAELLVDGRLVGIVAARLDFRVPLSPGQHKAELVIARIGWRETAQLTLRDGDRRTIHFEPPGAALHLDNQEGAGQLELLLDGEPAASVAPGARVAVAVAAGRVAVRVAGADGVQQRQQRLTPTQQVQAQAPPHARVKVTVSSQADRDLQVSWDGAALRTLAPGELWKAGELERGDHVLIVVDRGRQARALVAVHGRKAALAIELRAPAAPKEN